MAVVLANPANKIYYGKNSAPAEFSDYFNHVKENIYEFQGKQYQVRLPPPTTTNVSIYTPSKGKVLAFLHLMENEFLVIEGTEYVESLESKIFSKEKLKCKKFTEGTNIVIIDNSYEIDYFDISKITYNVDIASQVEKVKNLGFYDTDKMCLVEIKSLKKYFLISISIGTTRYQIQKDIHIIHIANIMFDDYEENGVKQSTYTDGAYIYRLQPCVTISPGQTAAVLGEDGVVAKIIENSATFIIRGEIIGVNPGYKEAPPVIYDFFQDMPIINSESFDTKYKFNVVKFPPPDSKYVVRISPSLYLVSEFPFSSTNNYDIADTPMPPINSPDSLMDIPSLDKETENIVPPLDITTVQNEKNPNEQNTTESIPAPNEDFLNAIIAMHEQKQATESTETNDSTTEQKQASENSGSMCEVTEKSETLIVPETIDDLRNKILMLEKTIAEKRAPLPQTMIQQLAEEACYDISWYTTEYMFYVGQQDTGFMIYLIPVGELTTNKNVEYCFKIPRVLTEWLKVLGVGSANFSVIPDRCDKIRSVVLHDGVNSRVVLMFWNENKIIAKVDLTLYAYGNIDTFNSTITSMFKKKNLLEL